MDTNTPTAFIQNEETNESCNETPRNNLIYFDFIPGETINLSYADVFEQDWEKRGIPFIEEDDSP